MPKRAENEDPTPRRRRRASAAAVEVAVADERGLLLRALLYSPKDLFAASLACAAACSIIVNALFLQSGPHPAPMFGSFVALPPALSGVSPLPRPRPTEADISPFDPKAIETRPADAKAAETKSADAKSSDPKSGDPLADLVKSINGGQGAAARVPQAAQSAPPRRIASVQRALTEFGYGQLKATGTAGPDTQVAIQKFERDRRLPVTGQINDRMVRELAIVIGHPID